MTKQISSDKSIERLSLLLVRMRNHSGLTQKEVAARMSTTQTAIARLESGQQNPSVDTLHNFARANGFCLEISFVRAPAPDGRTGCVFVIEDSSHEKGAPQSSV